MHMVEWVLIARKIDNRIKMISKMMMMKKTRTVMGLKKMNTVKATSRKRNEDRELKLKFMLRCQLEDKRSLKLITLWVELRMVMLFYYHLSTISWMFL